mgnify:CR=1 FL=1
MDVTEVLTDLLAEQEALDVIVAPLGAEQLALATPSPRWTVADQLAHRFRRRRWLHRLRWHQWRPRVQAH